ncbi:ferrous iron transporter FeoA [Thioploca ingrica]|uniref:Ferrous iron transporter FeoA n=1 Tax=Thioploca ingrica TaxID=40754 RepID=A0A090AQG1_9GAMM|nr:ferrous iron transporter FeoA [Thioploca ingrica]
MTLSLRDMALGDNGKVVGFQPGNKSYRKKLLAMGLTPGTEFSITRYAPLGDPVEIKVRGYSMSLRQDEAATLLVEKIER